MPPPFPRPSKPLLLPSLKTLPPSPFLSTFTTNHHQTPPQSLHPPPISSPSRIQKLIASQSDPLLAHEIFHLAAHHPNFRHSYSSFHSLIIKLARSHQFSLSETLIRRLKSLNYSVTPGLFSDLFEIYRDAKLPEKAIRAFHTMIDFDCNPLPKHLNSLLSVLVDCNRLDAALSILEDAERRFGISPDVRSYNILMRKLCLLGKLSVAYALFNRMFKRDMVPDVESYRIMMQGLCRRSQVNRAVDLLEDMLNKGFVPDTLSYTTLLNSLCRKKKLREAFKLLCRMKVKGCNPDIVHYNTVILGFCREGRALDAVKVIKEMPLNGCIPNLVSYRTLVNGLCDQGMLDEAKNYMEEMILKGLVPHFSAFHGLVTGFCNAGKMDDACGVLGEMLRNGVAPHTDTWVVLVPRICDGNGVELEEIFEKLVMEDWKRDTRIVQAGLGLEEYLIRRLQAKPLKI